MKSIVVWLCSLVGLYFIVQAHPEFGWPVAVMFAAGGLFMISGLLSRLLVGTEGMLPFMQLVAAVLTITLFVFALIWGGGMWVSLFVFAGRAVQALNKLANA